MSGQIETGGAAFPIPGMARGMTLRDYFAARALPQVIEQERVFAANLIHPEGFRFDLVASTAYRMADAMLKARVE